VECRDLTLALVGSGGDGVISTGEIIVKAAASEGLSCFLLKSFGPQIRGGESSCKIRITDKELLSIGESTDVLVCFNWSDFARFQEEIPLSETAIILVDEKDKTPDDQIPIEILATQTLIKVPFADLASKEVGNALTKNIVCLGVLEEFFHLPESGIEKALRKRFEKKSKEIVSLNMTAISVGQKWAKEYKTTNSIEAPEFYDFEVKEPQLVITGNEAAAMGALWAGLKFFAGYPITPATDIMEWLEQQLPRFGGTMIQAEDEIASASMVVGASFAGAKAMTSTSGPGIALMSEMIGLACIAEIPCVIVNVQRGGPSTGIPTKTSQSDLLQACYCTHGDAPHVVMAATDAKDCAMVSAEAFYISEKYQIPVILMLDQFVGQRIETVVKDELLARGIREGWIRKCDRQTPNEDERGENYKRYKYTDSGVSPVGYPGLKGTEYLASGIEHAENGDPVSSVSIHREMHEKRYKKMDAIRKEFKFMRSYGDMNSKVGILCWGSSKGPVREAILQAEAKGYSCKCLIPTCIMPLDSEKIQEFVDGCDKVIVADSSFSAQFLTYLRSHLNFKENQVKDLHFVDGMPLPVSMIINGIEEVHNELA
jgi:2-oxoglutarate/2-oxoacid ferredoxin oxidoreductase subunit alpha